MSPQNPRPSSVEEGPSFSSEQGTSGVQDQLSLTPQNPRSPPHHVTPGSSPAQDQRSPPPPPDLRRQKDNGALYQLVLGTAGPGLFQRMKNAADSTGVHEALTMMFHVGRFSADSYLNKLWSCVCIADFLLAQTENGKGNGGGVQYPMASIFKAESQFDSSFRDNDLERDPIWWRDLSLAFEKFRGDLMFNGNVNIKGWKNFCSHFRIATDLLRCFATACRRTVDNPLIVTPAYLCDQMVYLDKLIAGQKQYQLRDTENMAKHIDPERLAMVKRGEDVPKLEWKNKRKRQTTVHSASDEPKEKSTGKPKRKVRKQRVRDSPSNPQHFGEDNRIHRPETNLISSAGQIFSDGVTEFEGEVQNRPMICIETFRNMQDEVVTAPVKYRTADGNLEFYEAGAEEYMNMDSKKLSEVVVCPSPKAYVYFFRDAHQKSHFVCGEAEAKEYLAKVMEHDVDVRKIAQWKLKDPLKLITDLSMVDGGLLEGDLQESDFIIVPEGTDLFSQYFGSLHTIPFPTAKWMEHFDKQEEKEDEHGRGFRNGHHDCGWTREGVAVPTHNCQDEGIETLVAKPGYTGDDDLDSTLGAIMDQTTRLMDAKCFEGGERLMNNEARDTKFGQPFREKLGATYSRFDAATVARQKVPSPVATKRHVDNHNCPRKGYRVVAVFSFLCMWKGILYRVSIIMYTRASIGNHPWRNFLGRKLRQKLRDHVVERLGGLKYQDFSLTQGMEYLQQQAKVKRGNRPAFFLKPAAADLTESFFERNPESQWKSTESQELVDVGWVDFDLDERLQHPLKIIVLPEFDSRFGFVSSFASQINRFVSAGGTRAPEQLKLQLIYIALLSTSQIQFFYVVEYMIDDKDAILEEYQKKKDEHKIDVTLFRRYQKICEDLKFASMVGGPYNRWQAPPTTHEIFRDDGKLRENLAKIPALIENLDNGYYLNADGVLTKSPGTELTMVGTVASLSFAPLMVFTKCASTEEAINTAKQSRVNTTSSNTYYNALIEFLEEEDDSELKMKKDDKFVYRLFKAIAKGWETVIGTIENLCCAVFRKKEKYDVFFQGQDLFILDDTSNHVKVKKFDTEEWTDLQYD